MKREYIFLFMSYILFFFSPILLILFTVGCLVAFDLLTGIFKAKKIGQEINSKKMARSISKMIFYFIAIILSRLMEITFLPQIPIANITAGYIALVEFKSNIENISIITGTDILNKIINIIHKGK